MLDRNGDARADPSCAQFARGGALSAPDEAHQVGLRKDAALLIAPAAAGNFGQDGLQQPRRSCPVALGERQAGSGLRQPDFKPDTSRGATL